MRRITVVVLFVVVSIMLHAAQNTSGGAVEPAMMHMPLVVPLFIEDGNYTSTLIMVNGTTKTTYADVTLRGLDGKTLIEKRVNFPSFSQQRVAVSDLLKAANSSATSGSIMVMQSPDLEE